MSDPDTNHATIPGPQNSHQDETAGQLPKPTETEAEKRVAAVQAERRARYEAALKAHAEAERLMREVYGPAAASISACLTQLIALKAEIDAANRYLPDGENRIPSPDVFRGYPETGTRYVDQEETYYIDPATDEEIRPTSTTPKVLGFVDNGRRTVELAGRTRTVRIKQQGRAAYIPRPLASDVVLPGLVHDDGPIWPART